jgi:hypothetical protein
MFAPSGREYYRWYPTSFPMMRFFRSLKIVDEIAYSVVKQRKSEFRQAKLRQQGAEGLQGLEDPENDKRLKGSDIISLYMQRQDEESECDICLIVVTITLKCRGRRNS